MPVSLEVVQAAGNVVEYRMRVEIPKEQVTTEIEGKLKELGRTTKIKGFRQGKVPLRIIDQRFGQWVRQEVVGRLIEQSFRDSLQQQNLQPLGPPAIQLQDDRIHLEQGIFYTAIFTAIASEGLPVVSQPESSLEISDIPLFTAPTSQATTAEMPVVAIDGLVLDKPLVESPTSSTKAATIRAGTNSRTTLAVR
jgi:trigger factor